MQSFIHSFIHSFIAPSHFARRTPHAAPYIFTPFPLHLSFWNCSRHISCNYWIIESINQPR